VVDVQVLQSDQHLHLRHQRIQGRGLSRPIGNDPVGEGGFNILAHVGHSNYPGNVNAGYWGASGGDNHFFDYTDYKLGPRKDYQGFTFGLAWTYAKTKHTAPDDNTTAYMNAFGRNIGRDQVVLSVAKTF
jgi:hypothetical protein